MREDSKKISRSQEIMGKKEGHLPHINLPDLLELQKRSYREFLQSDIDINQRKYQGLHAAFLDVFGDVPENKDDITTGITNSDGSLILQYLNYSIGKPKYSVDEAKIRGLTYEAPLKVWFRLVQKQETGKIKELSEQEVYLCDIPLMTESGLFVVNGAERVIVTQIHRSPGVIFEEDEEKKISHLGKRLYTASIIPYRGAWLDFEFDFDNVLFVRIDKKRKIPVTTLLRVIGIETNQEIIRLFYDIETIDKNDFSKAVGRIVAEDVIDKKTGEIICELLQKLDEEKIKILKEKIDKIKVIKIDPTTNDTTILLTLRIDPTKNKKEAINLIYKVLRATEFITPELATNYIDNLLFKSRKYDLTKVGRFKINEKLKDIFSELSKRKDFEFEIPSERKCVLTKEDIIATIKYLINLNNGSGGEIDDIDHLGNRRVRAVGELLENQVRIGLLSLAKLARDRMNTADKKNVLTPRTIINPTPMIIVLRRFFGTSQLSQFMDQINPLAELTHKRRLSALGPGGLHRKHAGFEVRDVHYTHYGRICPIETPEGPNIGLITSMACYARVNEYGLIETPYFKVKDGKLTDEIEYLTADKEDKYIIAQANSIFDKENKLQGPVQCRYRGDIKYVSPKEVHYMDISPLQIISPSAGLIPFLEHDDANRALMGSNMQRQAVPLLISEKPRIATGIEERIARDSYSVITAKNNGEVCYVSSDEIGIYNDNDKVDIYYLKKYNRSNQDTCINYIPLVKVGDKVKKGQIIADGPCTNDGQLSLGRNVTVAFMSWEGYNFEDAILISERLVTDDVFTSIHIHEFEIEARDTKMGSEEITRDVPNVGAEDLLNLDESGIIRIGTEVKTGDILVGKTAPKADQQVTMEERLLKAIFGKKAEDVIDASLRVPPGIEGKVIDIKVFTRHEKISKKIEKKKLEEIDKEYKKKEEELRIEKENVKNEVQDKEKREKLLSYYKEKEKELEREKQKKKETLRYGDELPITVSKKVKVYIATRRKIQVGDKLAGRHGNKGVVAKILPIEDMPFMPDGTPVDIVLSPLSIPSRMNVGQLLEAMLGWAAEALNIQFICPVFDGPSEQMIISKIKEAKDYLSKEKNIPSKYLPTDDCKITLYDGRTGEPFKEKVSIGNMYIMKLVHLVEDKVHARSTGPYSLITRQPLGGKAQFGGQRIGEMEVWAIEGYGAAYTLQEFLTIKSDDVVGRAKVYESIIKGETFSEPGVPESFKVLVRELQGIGLNIELLSSKRETDKTKKLEIAGKGEKVVTKK